MGTHLLKLSKSFWMNTNMVWMVFKICFHFCALEESTLSIRKVKVAYWVNFFDLTFSLLCLYLTIYPIQSINCLKSILMRRSAIINLSPSNIISIRFYMKDCTKISRLLLAAVYINEFNKKNSENDHMCKTVFCTVIQPSTR